MHAWMAIANIVTELLIIVKFSKGEAFMDVPVPIEIKIGWGLALLGFGVYFWWMFFSGRRKKMYRRSKRVMDKGTGEKGRKNE
jgi:hypothetical protein